MGYCIISSKKTFSFFYEPYMFDNATKCSRKCTCSNSTTPDYALNVVHFHSEQYPRGHKHILGCEKFVNIENLVHNAHAQGYHYVVLNERRNTLKLLVSAIETNVGKRGVTAVYHELERKQNDLIKLIEMQSLAMIVARLTAQLHGMKVINTNYQYDMDSDVCEIVKTAASKLKRRISPYSFENLNCFGNPCFVEGTDMDDSPLENRVTENGKTLLNQLLNTTIYSWMLNFETNDWPVPEANPNYHLDPFNFLDQVGDGVEKNFDLRQSLDKARCL